MDIRLRQLERKLNPNDAETIMRYHAALLRIHSFYDEPRITARDMRRKSSDDVLNESWCLCVMWYNYGHEFPEGYLCGCFAIEDCLLININNYIDSRVAKIKLLRSSNG